MNNHIVGEIREALTFAAKTFNLLMPKSTTEVKPRIPVITRKDIGNAKQKGDDILIQATLKEIADIEKSQREIEATMLATREE